MTPVTSATAARLVTELFAIIDGQRWDELATVLTDDCVVERPGSPALTGLERISRFYRSERPIAAGRHEPEQVIGESDVAASWGRFTGETTQGQRVEERFAETYQLRDGRIARRTTYLHRRA
ncbi:nuclear transport factor 2 family protein [Micromonospora fluostatini]|uniref:Nuclear transport factor 2 family protein n=1 Tax=Micromonospora fluostatini TaxID=1629071 RepID=A0ABY2DF45_9ACTN|nr:nuclear transport factor 2 family protein [Micromonospora fluostatini]